MKQIIITTLLCSVGLLNTPAQASPNCVFESSGISISTVAHSRNVTHFKTIQAHNLHLGFLKGVGTFQLSEYACNHRGVELFVVVNPSASGQSVSKVLNSVLSILLKPSDLHVVEPQLSSLTEQDLAQPRSFPGIAELLGFDEFSVQWGEVNGVPLLVLKSSAN
ncbi:MAG TPA: hypothetical protein VGE55_11150 [Limnobacter sp.]|uniref:hypothetical protein n=1 Tax=Limnobacter sp. TaxID=2003368 RepID=UPI002ED96E1E